MLFTIFSVFYVLIAAAMIVLILLQRGAGADAGSGFGGGASATVFGARGSASFLTRATAVLAGLFFILSLVMGIYLSRVGMQKPQADLGVMSGVVTPTPASSAAAQTSPTIHPLANPPQRAVPQATQPAAPANNSEVPQATAPAKPKAAGSSGH
ncbi:MAG TPA: preprotein translocase subunit SecG [Rhodanobacteraceae bacterium]|nr:preprotein translocase subunit SecG [Rhodanobacteraceae bacterium]